MNIQNLVLDINKKPFQTITANVGEVASRFVKISIVDKSIPVDLTGVTVSIYAKKPDGKKVFNNVTIEDKTNGIILAELTSQILAVEGLVKLTLLLVKNDSKLCSKQFLLNVDSTIVDDTAIESTNEFTALTTALGKVNNIDSRFESINSSLDNKANISETKNLQTQINDLVLGAVGDGNNAEVVQARSGYTVLNDRLIDIEDKANLNYNKIKPAFTESSYIDKNTGKIMLMSANHYSSTDYIEVDSSFEYNVKTIMADDGSGLAYYDKNKVFISGVNLYSTNIKSTSLDIPSNAKYIRYSFYAKNGANSVDLSYLEEKSNNETINKLSKRIANIEKNNLITVNEIYFPYVRNVGHFIDNTGKVIAYEKYYISDIIELKKGDAIKITSKDPSGNVVALMSECDGNGNILSVIYTATVELKTINYTAEKDIYIKLCGHIDENIIIEKMDIQVADGLIEKVLDSMNKTIKPIFTESSYIDKNTGKIISMTSNHYSSTDYIEVNDNFNYIVNTKMENDASGLAYYDKNKVFISGVNLYTSTIQESELTLPKGTQYIRYSFHANQGKNDVVLSYLKEIYNADTFSEIGKEINELKEIKDNQLITTVEDNIEIVKNVGSFINNQGKELQISTYYVTEPISFKAGEILTVTSADPSGSSVARVSKFTENGQYVVLNLATKDVSTFEYTVTTDMQIKISGHINEDISVKKTSVIPSSSLKVLLDNNKSNSINYWSYAIWKVLCIGDSLTSGASFKEGWGEMAGTGASIDQNYPRILGRMLNAEVTNAGNSGYSASDWYNKNFSKYNYSEYDTFLIWLGTNYGCSSMPTDEEISTFVPNQSDVASTSNQSLYLIKLINEIKAINPDSLIVLMNTFASKSNYITHNSVIEQIAEKYNLPLIDMSDLSHTNRPELHCGVNNPHFGIAGNVFIANRIVEELAKYFEENPLRCELTYWQRKN